VSELTDIFPSTPVLKNNTKIAKASRAVLYSNLNTKLRYHKFNRSYCLQTIHKTDIEVLGDSPSIGHSDSNWTDIGTVQNIACPNDIITGDDISNLAVLISTNTSTFRFETDRTAVKGDWKRDDIHTAAAILHIIMYS